jgi:HK97 family phage major capsid protein
MGGADGTLGGDGMVVPVQPGLGTGPVVPGRRHQMPPLAVGEVQLRSIVAALESRSAYNEPVETRAASLTPAGAAVPVWWPPVEYGVEGRLAEAITTRPAPEQGNEFDYLATTTAAVLADTAEGAPKPDAGLVLSRRHVTLTKGAAHTDYSWELEADFEGVAAIVNNELAAGLIRWENAKIIAAIAADPGILAPTITGTNPGLVQIFQAAMAVRAAPNVGDPDLVILHPNDWYQLTTEVASTSGLFLSGQQIVQTGPQPMLWGMRVALTIAQTAGSCLLGVASAAAWFMREGPRVIVDPYSQAVNNLTRMIYEERGAAGLLVPGRWAKFTMTGALAAAAQPAKK